MAEGGFVNFLYNPKTGAVLGRTADSWIKIIVFYIIFYICLSIFFALMLTVFFQTINEKYPKYTLGESRIGDTPGVAIVPRILGDKEFLILEYSTAKNNESSYRSFLDQMHRDFELMHKLYPNISEKYPADCNKENEFGYPSGNPCIFVKINNIFDWEPVAYRKDEVPATIETSDIEIENNIIISCGEVFKKKSAEEPEEEKDITFTPKFFGVPAKAFPYNKNVLGRTPMALIQIQGAKVNKEYSIKCGAFAANIVQNNNENIGVTRIQMVILNSDH